MWLDKDEIAARLAYNRTVGELGKLWGCSSTARSFINRTIAENMQIINELMSLSALTSNPQAGLIAETKENSDGPSGNARSGSGTGSGTQTDIGGVGVHLQGQGTLRRRYITLT